MATANTQKVTQKRAPMTGRHYTVGRNLRTQDRSWVEHIWKVLETNGKSALIVDPFSKRDAWGGSPQVVLIEEFDWTPADEMAEALNQKDTDA